MKKLFVSLVLCTLYFLSFSQKISVKVFERQEFVCFRNTTIDSVLKNSDITNNVTIGEDTYIINLDKNSFSYYVGETFILDSPINVIISTNDQLIVNILIKNFDYYMVINFGQEENTIYFCKNGINMTTVKKMLKFDFYKN